MSDEHTMLKTLLRANALNAVRLGISVSDSPDLHRLGLSEMHFRLALGELARVILVSGGQILYGGHLAPDGYTTFLANELQRFGRRDRPFHSILTWQEHRKWSCTELRAYRTSLGLYGSMYALNPAGEIIDPTENRSEEPMPELDDDVKKKSLTAMRRYLGANSNGRIFLGGKRHNFQGDIPGLVEEAILAIEAKQPIYLAGGFGGVTADLARIVGVDGGEWLPRCKSDPAPDPRYTKGMENFGQALKRSGFKELVNGLTPDENRTLALSYRPSEIAALVSLGLGRMFSKT